MRVLFLTLWYPNAANPILGTFIHDQVVAFRDLGIDVQVVQPIPKTPFPINLLKTKYNALSKIPEKEIYRNGVVYHPRYLDLPMHYLYEFVGKWMYDGIIKMVMEIYRQWPFNIIHSHATYPCGWCANMIRDFNLNSIKSVHTIHRMSIIDVPQYNKKCYSRVKDALRNSDWSIFVSKEGKRLGEKLTEGEINKKNSYITNGVNISKFKLNNEDLKEVSELRKKYSDTLNILFVGYLSERKGIKELLSAYKSISQNSQGMATKLFLVGHNLLGKYIENFIKSNDLVGKVILVGPVLHNYVKRWLEFTDIFILPSHTEGLATVLFESLYMKKASIFTRVGGTNDIIKNGEHAILIKPNSVPEIIRAINQLCSDRELRKSLGFNGHRLIRDNYTWEINAKKNIEVYSKLFH
jgi:teichuronic acid biosynthesis glycosyltransferase TuaC